MHSTLLQIFTSLATVLRRRRSPPLPHSLHAEATAQADHHAARPTTRRTHLYALHIVVTYWPHPDTIIRRESDGLLGERQANWTARLHFQGGDFARLGYVEGEIRTRYVEPTLARAIDMVLQASERLGLPRSSERPFALLYDGDGESPNFPPPDGWRKTLADEAKRRGWMTYDDEQAPEV